MAQQKGSSPAFNEYAALLLVSLSALAYEINLTRLFSVAQFYHFAFMIVSLALLGSGASGTFLAILPHLGRTCPRHSLAWLALLSGLTMLAGYLVTNLLPFDSFSIAVDRKQAMILVVHYVALALPFFFGGMATSLYLEVYPLQREQTYAINLVGSALGCVLALALPALLGGEGVVIFTSFTGALAAWIAAYPRRSPSNRPAEKRSRNPLSIRTGRAIWILIPVATSLLVYLLAGLMPSSLFMLRLSPYKSLSYALQYPDARPIHTRWNAFSRVDLLSSPGIRSFPGLSYLYLRPLPPEDAIFVDGDDLSPVVRPGSALDFAAYMPSAVAFELRLKADALILEPRGGLDILVSRHLGASTVTAVEENALVVAAAGEVYRAPGVNAVVESGRSYLRRTTRQFDIILYPLTGAYHAVQSGAYSLAEDYRYTVESFQEALLRLNDQGCLVVTRWLQTPPSEELRLFATGLTAIEGLGGQPREQIIAFRGYNTLTLLIKNSPFTPAELRIVRRFAADRAYDLVIAPDIRPEEANRFNILSEPVYYQLFKNLLETQPQDAFFASYPYDVSPPTDDHPFFGHFFKWSQAGQVLASLGRTWQPFGGAGYFAILALLALALFSSGVLILLPVILARRKLRGQGLAREGQSASRLSLALPAYFALIGFAYLLVEMPLIQRFILFLGQPAYAMAVVLFTLLLFSGLGSRWSHKIPLRISLVVLAVVLLALPLLLQPIFRLALGLSLPLRLALGVVVLAPVGFLMGMPFPSGLGFLLPGPEEASRLPWVWSINGAASVIAAVLAALLALSFGFGWVLRIGALCYAAAWITVLFPAPPLAGSPAR